MMTKNTKAADALVILSRIIEPVLRNPDFTWKLKDELDFLKDYIEMGIHLILKCQQFFF